MRSFYVYIMASRSRVIYVGVTNDLVRRVQEHKSGVNPGFTKKYRVKRLVYFEEFTDIRVAIAREKELKGWIRARKTALIERRNPTWEDLAEQILRSARWSALSSGPSLARASRRNRARGTAPRRDYS